ncbi:Carbonyl Reductase [Nadph] 3 [Manis pentadactyla]|nr:Carbonyl Reductase [Nadph] 3 [Manis pentadactyla]
MARDPAQGQAAMQQLQAKGLSPHFHLLDICNLQSIRALWDFLLKEYGGLNVLVNTQGTGKSTNMKSALKELPPPLQGASTGTAQTSSVCSQLNRQMLKGHVRLKDQGF